MAFTVVYGVFFGRANGWPLSVLLFQIFFRSCCFLILFLEFLLKVHWRRRGRRLIVIKT